MKAKGLIGVLVFMTSQGFAETPAHDKSNCICTKIYQPVCGVDGKTYSNACMAACVKVPIAKQGICGSELPQKLIET